MDKRSGRPPVWLIAVAVAALAITAWSGVALLNTLKATPKGTPAQPVQITSSEALAFPTAASYALPSPNQDIAAYSRSALALYGAIVKDSGLQVRAISTFVVPAGKHVLCQQGMDPIVDSSGVTGEPTYCGPDGAIVVITPIFLKAHLSSGWPDNALAWMLNAFTGAQAGIDNDTAGCYAGLVMATLVKHRLVAKSAIAQMGYFYTPYGLEGYDIGASKASCRNLPGW